MRRIVCIILTLLLIFSVPFGGSATNMDGTGGGLGNASKGSGWRPGNEGVRITIIDIATERPASDPFDWSNNPPSSDIFHFGKVNKLDYISGKPLKNLSGDYVATKPDKQMPTIIQQGNNKSNIAAVRAFFSQPERVEKIFVGLAGMSKADMDPEKYHIMVEPIAYFKFKYQMYAMTATEAALYAKKLGGNTISGNPLYEAMGHLTHKNLAASMYLVDEAFDIAPWPETKVRFYYPDEIIASLGVGEVPLGLTVPDDFTIDYVYRTDTEVISATKVTATGDLTSTDSGEVKFVVSPYEAKEGEETTPEGEPKPIHTGTHSSIQLKSGTAQQAWIKWRTPKEPGIYKIAVSTEDSLTLGKKLLGVEVVDNVENTPPNPTAFDKKPYDFKVNKPKIPTGEAAVTSLSWTTYSSSEEEVPGSGSSGHGNPGDPDYEEPTSPSKEWEWTAVEHKVTLTKSGVAIVESDQVPITMRSGYGISAEIAASLTATASADYSPIQTVSASFPEFEYETYNRLLELNNTKLNFKENEFSVTEERVHFTPVWYPDGGYSVYFEVRDAWTPVGELKMWVESPKLGVTGSVFDDWYVRRKR